MSLYFSASYVKDPENGSPYAVEVALLDRSGAVEMHSYTRPPGDLSTYLNQLDHWEITPNDLYGEDSTDHIGLFEQLSPMIEEEPVYGYKLWIQRNALYNILDRRKRKKKVEGGLWRELGTGVVQLPPIVRDHPSLQKVCAKLGISVARSAEHKSIRRAEIYRKIHQRLLSETGAGGKIDYIYAPLRFEESKTSEPGPDRFLSPKDVEERVNEDDEETSMKAPRRTQSISGKEPSEQTRGWKSDGTPMSPDDSGAVRQISHRSRTKMQSPLFLDARGTEGKRSDERVLTQVALFNDNERSLLSTWVRPPGITASDNRLMVDGEKEMEKIREAPTFKAIGRQIQLQAQNRDIWIDCQQPVQELLAQAAEASGVEKIKEYFQNREFECIRQKTSLFSPGKSLERVAQEEEIGLSEEQKTNLMEARQSAKRLARLYKKAQELSF